MGMTINQDGKIRQVSSFEKGKVLRDGKLRSISIIKVKVGEVLYTVWEWITAFIFTTDGFGIETKDGYIVKFKED